MSRGTSTECDVVSVMSLRRPGGGACSYGQFGLPSLKLALTALRLLANIRVSLECYKREVLGLRKGA
jgi:hypothetical protein